VCVVYSLLGVDRRAVMLVLFCSFVLVWSTRSGLGLWKWFGGVEVIREWWSGFGWVGFCIGIGHESRIMLSISARARGVAYRKNSNNRTVCYVVENSLL